MKYRTFGKTGEKVSALGFGCMRLPVIENNSAQINEPEATRMLRYAIDNGVNYVDTAYPYHGTGFDKGGESEPFVGRALGDGYRDKVLLATKLPCWLVNKREDMDRLLDEQLKRLATDHIDNYLLHSLNTETWPRMKALGAGEFLRKAIADGRIRYAGFSFHDHISLFKEIADSFDWSFCQLQYNYIDEHYQAGREGLKYAAAKGMGIIAMEPLRGGNLVTNVPSDAMAIFDGSQEKRTNVDWALSWLWDDRDVHVVLSGMSEFGHVEENVRLANSSSVGMLSTDDHKRLSKVKEIFKARMKVDCTGCAYCMPCPYGVNIPKMFSFYNNFYFLDSERFRNMLRFQYSKMVPPAELASKCVECGRCEEHCPQNIAIRAELKNVAALFEAKT